TAVKDLSRFGRPSTSNTDENVKRVKKLVFENCYMSERKIAAELNILNGSVH
ncbi:hypothetical protein EAI_08917, partial [Harpegnathos saltator]